MRNLLLSAFICLFFNNMWGQNSTFPDRDLFSKSPQAYQFDKFGNIPLNINTGGNVYHLNLYHLPDLYMGESFDINLSYYGTGFIPSKKSNYVGMDWLLNFGGAITRDIRGVPDDYFPSMNRSHYSPDGYFYNLYGHLEGTRRCNKNNYAIYESHYDDIDPSNVVKVGIACGETEKDLFEIEPDVFNFNFMGISGYFYIGNDGVPIVVSKHKQLRIDLSELSSTQPLFDYSTGARCMTKASTIVITDNKGIKYYFGGEYRNQEVSYSLNDAPPAITAWSLSKVVYPNLNTITIEYKTANLDYTDRDFCRSPSMTPLTPVQLDKPFFVLTDYNVHKSQEIKKFRNVTGPLDELLSVEASNITVNTSVRTTYSLVKKTIPESIKFNGIYIAKFNYDKYDGVNVYDPSSLKLTSISLYSKIGRHLEDVILNYKRVRNYFFLQELKKKMRLPYISWPSLQNTSLVDSDSFHDIYQFDYYKMNNLPSARTIGIDHFGYWNGNSNNKLIPDFMFNENTGHYYYTDYTRATNPSLCDVGLLKSIKYPTQGKTEFIYEPNQYSKAVDRNLSSQFKNVLIDSIGYVGGGRLKEIINYDHNGETVGLKKYKYVKNFNPNSLQNGKSSGILSNFYRNLRYFKGLNDDGVLDGAYIFDLVFHSDNIIDASMNGTPVLYSEVTEIQDNGSYTKYYFTDWVSHPDDSEYKITNIKPSSRIPFPENILNVELPYNSSKYKRGHLKRKELYDKNFNKIKSVSFDYTDIDEPRDSNYVSHVYQRQFRNYTVRLYGGSFKLTKKVDSVYFDSGVLSSMQKFEYTNSSNGNLVSSEFISSYGEGRKTTYKYAKDMPLNDVTINMIQDNMIGVPLEVSEYKQGNLISKKRTKYDDTFGIMVPRSVSSVDIETLGTNNEIFTTEVTYDRYDSKGNLLQYTTRGGIPIAIVYGYRNTQPIAQIIGATYEDIEGLITNIVNKSNLDADPDTEKLFIDALDEFRKLPALKNYQITTYTYDPIGVTSITPPSGIRQVYIYDEANRLKEVREGSATGKLLKAHEYHYKQ